MVTSTERDGAEGTRSTASAMEHEDVPLCLWPCELILRPQAGSRIQGSFANARTLASLTTHDVIVEGNDVQVLVTPLMNDADCQRAYEAALQTRYGREARARWGQ